MRKSRANNIPLRNGNEVILWNKLNKEVKLGRVAGPFDKIPYENFIQSPIGLVPKLGNEGKTRLIFHLSYNFATNDKSNTTPVDERSLNQDTPKEICMVKYNDLDHAIKSCLRARKQGAVVFDELTEKIEGKEPEWPVYLSKTDCPKCFSFGTFVHNVLEMVDYGSEKPMDKKISIFH